MTVIDEIKTAQRNVTAAKERLSDIGRAIHKLRTNQTFHHAFDTFAEEVAGDWTEDEYEIFFEIGTPIVVLYYFHSRWNDEIKVVFPAEYLTRDDYLDLERVAIAAREERKVNRERLLNEQRASERVEQRKALFEELKQEFGE